MLPPLFGIQFGASVELPSRPNVVPISAGKDGQGEVNKKLPARKVEMHTLYGSAKGIFKNIIGRYRLGRLSQREVKKELSTRKVLNVIC